MSPFSPKIGQEPTRRLIAIYVGRNLNFIEAHSNLEPI